MSKSELRKYFSHLRNSIKNEERKKIDKLIIDKVINSDFFDACDTVLIYVSVGSEIDTKDFISHLFSVGKKVAVPYCSNNRMDFYEISSFDDLIDFQFGIPTVDINHAKKAIITKNTLCFVPAYAFDEQGYRLGYGGGYYDKFLAKNSVRSVGLCRKSFFIKSLPREQHDIKVEIIVTEEKVINIS